MQKFFLIVTFGVWIFLVYFLRESNFFYFVILNKVSDLGLIAVFLFILLQCVSASFLLPCSAFTLIAGSLWGWKLGLVVSVIATVLSSATTYFIGSHFYSKAAPEAIQRYSDSIAKYIVISPFLSSVLVHVNPVFPASALGYFFGIKKSRFAPYILGCFIGTIPLQFIFVYLSGMLTLR